jgi:hypothetical protein
VSEIKLVFSIPPHRPTPNIRPSRNAAPTDPLPVVRYDARAGERSLDGLVPFWAKDIKVGFSNINAKAGGSKPSPRWRWRRSGDAQRHGRAPQTWRSTLCCGAAGAVRVHKTIGAFTIKALCKCFGRRICREIHRQDDLPSILVAVKPRRLIPVAIEPVAHRDHLTSKIRSQHSNDQLARERAGRKREE